MRDETKILDIRSTGRRKGRRALYNARVPYSCVGYLLPDTTRFKCNKTSTEPPKDAPSWFEEIWPTANRVLTGQLQVDHESKDLWNNELEYLNWKCPSCHKIDDARTGIGESQINHEYFGETKNTTPLKLMYNPEYF